MLNGTRYWSDFIIFSQGTFYLQQLNTFIIIMFMHLLGFVNC